jgi:hypothetical protein
VESQAPARRRPGDASLLHGPRALEDRGQSAFGGATLVRLRRESIGGGVALVLRSTERGTCDQGVLEEVRARR